MRDLDLVQWRALVAASIKTDLRATGHSLDFGGASRGTSALIGTFLVIFLMGLGIAVFIAFSRDLFLSATLHVFVLAFVIASSLLIEFQAVVLSPADARQLSFQPVSSRTFLAARLTSVLVYVGGMTLAFLVAPLIAFTLTSHGGPLVSLAAAGTSIAAAVTVTLAVICVYVGVLRFVSPRRLTSALSYLQLLFGFVVYGSYMIVPQLLGEQALRSAAMPRTRVTLMNPAAWFAAWVALAGGERTWITAAGALLSLAALGLCARLVAGRLSLDYAERVAAMGTTNPASDRRRPLASGWLFADEESRAVAVLARAQFRHDMRFRMTVLSIVPLTLVYLFAGFNEGAIDPFEGAGGGQVLIYMAVMFFPPMLRNALVQSDAYRAAWVFHGTPASKAALVLGLKNFVTATFLLPYLFFLAVIYTFVIGRPHLVVIHVGLLGLISHLLLLVDLMLRPEVPFSRPPSRAGRTGATFISLAIVGLVGGILHWVLRVAYATAGRTAMLVGVLILLNLAGELALRVRLRPLEAEAQFDL